MARCGAQREIVSLRGSVPSVRASLPSAAPCVVARRWDPAMTKVVALKEEEKLARRSRWSRSNFAETGPKTGIMRLING
jgi:hypothetical protein